MRSVLLRTNGRTDKVIFCRDIWAGQEENNNKKGGK